MVFRLRAHALQVEFMTWTQNSSPTRDLCNANDWQNEQHVLFHRRVTTSIHMWSLFLSFITVPGLCFLTPMTASG